LRSKIAFYLSLLALIFGCLALLELIVGEGVTGWLFTVGVIGTVVCIPLAVILELITK